ncbi:terminase large subunit domain-containing protein [Rickettsiales bacterium LUAb2]
MFAQGINIFASKVEHQLSLSWSPQAGKQETAFNYLINDVVDVLCYGGARGGGKSELGISYTIKRMLKHGHKFNGIYLRNTSVELEDIISRFKDKLEASNIPYRFNSQKNTFVINGAKLKMFYTEGRGLDALQGGNYNHIVLEEPQLMAKLDVVMFKVYSMLRTIDKTCPTKILLLCNPLGAGTQYIKRNFVEHGENNIIINDKKKRQVFVKATVHDNPLLLENDPTYLHNLESLPEQMRKAWLEGDFNVLSGTAFPISKDIHAQEIHIPIGTEFFCSMDWGYGAKTVVGFYAVFKHPDKEVLYRFDELVFTETGASQVARLVKQKITYIEAKGYVYTGLVGDPSVYNHTDSRSIADTFSINGLKIRKANNDRKWGLLATSEWVKSERFVIHPHCKEFWDTVPYLVLKEDDYDISQKPKQDDHCYDECRYAVMSRSQTREDLYLKRLVNGRYE